MNECIYWGKGEGEGEGERERERGEAEEGKRKKKKERKEVLEGIEHKSIIINQYVFYFFLKCGAAPFSFFLLSL
jgi:hypothetical protein